MVSGLEVRCFISLIGQIGPITSNTQLSTSIYNPPLKILQTLGHGSSIRTVRVLQILMLLLLAVSTYSCGRSVGSLTPSVKAQEPAAVSSSNNKVDFVTHV